MPDYRRVRIAGGTYFVTVNLADRDARLLTENIALLRTAFAATFRELPARTDAIVVLPDHLHAVWTLPRGDADFSLRWSRIKARFSHALAAAGRRSWSKRRHRELGLWQRRFWEHAVRDEADLRRCIEYRWINPLKHGHVRRVSDWPHSSFHRDVRRGIVAADWAGEMPEGEFGERRSQS
jgi:putative transposase